ncbi:hypothetical protein [Flavihumibacter sp. UBA7668]|uniref:hypothetical protein n=1 Tax=Flavihumibacter sp. UBA7668 TaxID=1946542 RepID=UPI0025B9C298|nr:hypothetical protein [Flavihumibacter sp. UBA7668]
MDVSKFEHEACVGFVTNRKKKRTGKETSFKVPVYYGTSKSDSDIKKGAAFAAPYY